ncbi:hypothetical protein ACXYUI_34175, partial [Klebsiella pneumoniae]
MRDIALSPRESRFGVTPASCVRPTLDRDRSNAFGEIRFAAEANEETCEVPNDVANPGRFKQTG